MHIFNRPVQVAFTLLSGLGLSLALTPKLYAQPEEAESNNDDNSIEEVTIEASKIEDDNSIETEQLKTVAGGGNDILKAIEALPGVTLSGDGLGGEPVIRGSSPIDNQYFVNGVRVGYVFHNDGDSIFNPNLVDNFDLYAGAWQPYYGNAIGGVINVDMSYPKSRTSIGNEIDLSANQITKIDLGFTRAGIMHAGEISDNQRFYVSLRESLLFFYIKAFFDEEESKEEDGFSFSQVPRNRDYQLSYQWDINDTYNLEIFATGAKDYIGFVVEEDSEIADGNPDLEGDSNIDTSYNNQAAILTIDEEAYLAKWRLNALQEDIEIKFGRAIDLDGKVYNNALTTDYDFAASSWLDLNVGFEILQEIFDYDATGRNQPCNEEFQECPPGFVAPIITSKGKVTTDMPSVFINSISALNDDWALELGVRANYNSYSEQTFIEPRIGLNWSPTDLDTSWLRYGQHHQFFKNFEYAYIIDGFGTDNLDLPEAQHWILGYGRLLDDAPWMPSYIQVETYYKDLDNLVLANPDAQTEAINQNNNQNNQLAQNIDPYVNGATGKAYGIELLVRKDLTENFTGWATLAYSKTERYNEITKETFNFEYDQPWIMNLVGTYRFTDKLSLSAKWRFQSGRLYTDIIGANPIYPEDANGNPDPTQDPIAYDPIEGEINGERFDPLHRLDLRVDILLAEGRPEYSWRHPRIVAYFEVLNAYGYKSQIDWDYEPDYSDRDAEYAFPESVLPTFGFTFTF